MARLAHTFVLSALLLAAGSAYGQSLLKVNYGADLELSENTTTTGLNLVPSTNGVGSLSGRMLNDSTLCRRAGCGRP